MTAIGKMMVIFVFLITLVWCGLTVNTFVTRTNWRAEAKKSELRYKEAAAAAATWEKNYKDLAIAHEAAQKVFKEELKNTKNLLRTIEEQYANVVAQYNAQLVALRNEDINVEKYQNNIDKLNNEVKSLQTQVATLQVSNDRLRVSAEASLTSEQKAILARDAEFERAERFVEQIRKLNERIQALQTGTASIDARPIVPSGFRASVTFVSDDKTLLQINKGANIGLKPGMIMLVSRTKPTKLLGRLTLGEVILPDQAVGTFTPLSGLEKADYPRAGDTVTADTK